MESEDGSESGVACFLTFIVMLFLDLVFALLLCLSLGVAWFAKHFELSTLHACSMGGSWFSFAMVCLISMGLFLQANRSIE